MTKQTTIVVTGALRVNANSVDPDQTLHSMASDLGLHCLPLSLLWDAGHDRVKIFSHTIPMHECISHRSLIVLGK